MILIQEIRDASMTVIYKFLDKVNKYNIILTVTLSMHTIIVPSVLQSRILSMI